MEIRLLEPGERASALRLAEDVFMRFVAPDYSEQGVSTFLSYVRDGTALNALIFYGAFEDGALIGMLAMRSSHHISLFFVDGEFQGRGVGRSLFDMIRGSASSGVITVHSSPYAKGIYQKLGFVAISDEQVSDGIRYIPMKYPCERPIRQTGSDRRVITKDSLRSIVKSVVPDTAAALDSADLECLVGWLCDKDDAVRYPAFLLLLQRSTLSNDVLLYWDRFVEMLSGENPYQRGIGLALLAENAKWDEIGKTEAMLPDYIALLQDQKPVTIRQCVQNLQKIVASHPGLNRFIAEKLIALDLEAIRQSMRKLVLTDILTVLLKIRETERDEAIELYVLQALSGGILDAKTKKRFRLLFGAQNA